MSDKPILEVKNVSVHFGQSGGLLRPGKKVTAVRDISMTVRRGENFGIVGESGSGKSTLLKAILGLVSDVDGEVWIDGRKLADMDRLERARIVQPVFQDPHASLNPRHQVFDIISKPLLYQKELSKVDIKAKVHSFIDLVGLPKRCAHAYPGQLSGGQKQRVAVARALIVEPRLVVCDEPTSALDVSVQAQILNLLNDMQKEFGLTYLMVSHNLAVIEQLSANVAVMYLGRVVEQARSEILFSDPRHPYTRALLASNLTPDPSLGLPNINIGMTFPIQPPRRPVAASTRAVR